MIYKLTDHSSIASQYLAELRHHEWQKNKPAFRRNLIRLGHILGYELSKHLQYKKKSITTPLGQASCALLEENLVLATILRAGLPLHQGLLEIFDNAENAYISAYRKHDDNGNFVIDMPYLTCPSLSNKTLIISDPMLASGSSIDVLLEKLPTYGTPKEIHIVSIIAAAPGLEFIHRKHPDVHFWIGDIDPELNELSYIVPGLGDAGDLAFGEKLQR